MDWCHTHFVCNQCLVCQNAFCNNAKREAVHLLFRGSSITKETIPRKDTLGDAVRKKNDEESKRWKGVYLSDSSGSPAGAIKRNDSCSRCCSQCWIFMELNDDGLGGRGLGDWCAFSCACSVSRDRSCRGKRPRTDDRKAVTRTTLAM